MLEIDFEFNVSDDGRAAVRGAGFLTANTMLIEVHDLQKAA